MEAIGQKVRRYFRRPQHSTTSPRQSQGGIGGLSDSDLITNSTFSTEVVLSSQARSLGRKESDGSAPRRCGLQLRDKAIGDLHYLHY